MINTINTIFFCRVPLVRYRAIVTAGLNIAPDIFDAIKIATKRLKHTAKPALVKLYPKTNIDVPKNS